MSHKLDLTDLDRDAATSLTAQLVERFRDAIDRGELGPGEKLPTTRALAEEVGVNHLTAVRAYRRLAEEGYVTATVGRGTFVRRVPPPAAADGPGDVSWQAAVLPEAPPSYPNQVLAQSLRLPVDPDAISFAHGWPDPALYPVADLAAAAREVFDELGADTLTYSEPAGVPELRELIAARGREAHFASDPEEIVVTSGARQGLDLVGRALVSPGDVVAVESPTFMGTLTSLQRTGARVVGVPVDEDGLDVAALERLLARHEVKLVALQSSSHNPTGADLSDQRRERLLALARERSFFVLDDGVYATVRYTGDERPRLRAAAPGHVIYVDSLSKTVAGGLRLGWLAAAGPARQRLLDEKLAADMHTSTLVQHVVARYLAAGRHEALLAATNPIYRERRDALLESLRRRLGDEVEVAEPRGGHHLWLRLRPEVDERLLVAECLRHGVGAIPGAAMTAEPLEQAHLRLSFSMVPLERLDEGVRRIAVALRAVRRAQRQGLVAVS